MCGTDSYYGGWGLDGMTCAGLIRITEDGWVGMNLVGSRTHSFKSYKDFVFSEKYAGTSDSPR